MSRSADIQLAKWLIREGYAEKNAVESWLNAKLKAEKAGKNVSDLLTLLVKKGVVEAEKFEQIKAEFLKEKALNESLASEEKVRQKAAVQVETVPVEESLEEMYETEKDTAVAKTGIKAKVNRDRDTRLCPECNTNLSLDLKDCNVCGAHIPSDAWIQCVFCNKSQPVGCDHCEHCGCDPQTGESGPKTAICEVCAIAMLPNTAICYSCGSEQKNKRSDKATLFATAHVVVLVAFVIFLVPSIWIGSQYKKEIETLATTLHEVVFYGEDVFRNVSPKILPDQVLDKTIPEPNSKLLAEILPLAKNNNWKGVAKQLEARLEESDPLTLSLLGLSYYHLEEKQSLAALQKARPDISDLNDLFLRLRYEEARKIMLAGDSASAYATIKPVLEGQSKIARVNFWGGLMALKENQFEEAQQWFVKATKLQPKEDLAHLLLYKMYKNLDPKRASLEKASFQKEKERADLFKEFLN